MLSFILAINTFVFCVFVFFLVFAYTCLLWTNRDKTKLQNIMTGVCISLLYTFKIAVLGTGFFVLVYLIAFYWERFS
jgi:hypothetical protein